MNDDGSSTLYPLVMYLTLASLTAVGGGVIMLAPDVHHYVVEHHLMTSQQFAAAYTIAQAAPGPNFLFITLVGWQAGGWLGAILTTVAVMLPSSLLTLLVMRLTATNRDSRLGRAFRTGLAPVSVGMLFAASWVLASASGVEWHSLALVAATVLLVLRTKLNPVFLMALGGLAGLLGFV